MLRGGAFKPRTSPYAFQGLRGDGIKLYWKQKETGLPIVTEIMDLSQLYLFEEVGRHPSRGAEYAEFEMLKELGRLHKPVLLKRGAFQHFAGAFDER